jgi:predicted alpha/beta hydrolase family esterase
MQTAMDRTSFLVLHGWPNRRPDGHWQRWLADRLAEDEAQVLYPQLPHPPRVGQALTASERRSAAHVVGSLRG